MKFPKNFYKNEDNKWCLLHSQIAYFLQNNILRTIITNNKLRVRNNNKNENIQQDT